MTELPPELLSALTRAHLLRDGERPRATPLAGGVSSDIWRIELSSGPVCLKRALPKLKVAADWRAPVSRNAYEVAWMETAGALVPGAVPRLRAHDAESGWFVMDFLDPATHKLWKAELRDGRADPEFAAQVGAALVRIHAGTAGRPEIAQRFPTDAIFHAIRLEPYLEATARAHSDLSAAILDLVRVTASTKRALVHGDISPKNILVGPSGPVFLDAECAWYGDPAFDLAFCLNHLLLKCLWMPATTAAFLTCFDALVAAYRAGIAWEAPAELERRTARLLPGLFLARIDGKSPVEYLTADADKSRVRRVARALIATPPETLAQIRAAWEAELKADATA